MSDTKVIVSNRLSQAAYASLAKQTQALLPKVPSTDGQAFFACGVELVLRMLREGYVIETEQ